MQSAHPGWCDPRYWRFTDIDVQHRSTPTLLTTCDHEWWFTLVRADEWTDLRHADPAAGRVGHHPLGKSTAGELDVEVVALAGHVRVACGAIEMMIAGAPRYDLAASVRSAARLVGSRWSTRVPRSRRRISGGRTPDDAATAQ